MRHNIYGHCLFVVTSLLRDASGIQFLEFSSQNETAIKAGQNYAILNEGSSNLNATAFTICSSIKVSFFRGYQAFYTMRQNGTDNLWFSLTIHNQYLSGYVVTFNYFGSDVFSAAKLHLRPHGWSHACTSVDSSGHVLVVINGVLTHNTTVGNPENMKHGFKGNLMLGAAWFYYTKLEPYQSEASVTNVNIFSDQLSLTKMKQITSTGQCTQGNLLSWSEATWTMVGKVETKEMPGFCQENKNNVFFNFPYSFTQASDCLKLCPRLGKGGRVPTIQNLNDSKSLVNEYRMMLTKKESNVTAYIVGPFTLDKSNGFVDFYVKHEMPIGMWSPGQPNGHGKQKSTMFDVNNYEGRIWDVYDNEHIDFRCQCQIPRKPILRLRGLCEGSYIDNVFTILYHDGSIVFGGWINSKISLLKSLELPTWFLSLNLKQTTASIKAEGSSYTLGKHQWTIANDSVRCNNGDTYTRDLKMTSCSDEEFTCSNGDCVTMDQRCAQLPDCEDKSDERGCKILVLEEGYNKEVPPISSSRSTDKSVVPAEVYVSMRLFKVVDIEEEDHSIKLQFEITLNWKDSRLTYHTLKEKTSFNALRVKDFSQLWLPLLIYANTDQKETTRLGEHGNGEWSTSVLVVREGNFTRSGLEEVDEIEIFRGDENTLSMQQTYTHQFQCVYQLMHYPFDKQVGTNSQTKYSQVCSIDMVVRTIDQKTVP